MSGYLNREGQPLGVDSMKSTENKLVALAGTAIALIILGACSAAAWPHFMQFLDSFKR